MNTPDRIWLRVTGYDQELYWKILRGETPSDPRGCWIWQGPPVISYLGKVMKVQRAVWLMSFHKTPRPDQSVYRRCKTKLCVRPDHLYIGGTPDRDQMFWRGCKDIDESPRSWQSKEYKSRLKNYEKETEGNKTETVRVRMTKTLRADLDAALAHTGAKEAHFIRSAIREWIDRVMQQPSNAERVEQVFADIDQRQQAAPPPKPLPIPCPSFPSIEAELLTRKLSPEKPSFVLELSPPPPPPPPPPSGESGEEMVLDLGPPKNDWT